MNYIFGVDLGGTTVKMGVFSEEGQIIDKWEIKTRTENAGEAILSDIATSVLKKISEHEFIKGNILGIGIGIPAPVTADGCIPGAVNLGWGPRSIKKELESISMTIDSLKLWTDQMLSDGLIDQKEYEKLYDQA